MKNNDLLVKIDDQISKKKLEDEIIKNDLEIEDITNETKEDLESLGYHFENGV